MVRSLRYLFMTLVAFTFLAVSAQAQVAQPNPIGQQGLQVLHNHVRPAITSGQAVPMGVLPATQRIQFAIMLPLRNQSELTSLLSRLYDPSSPDFHQFLNVEQFTEQFGPTVADHQAVLDFAKANGLTVTNTHSNRLVVDMEGSVAQVEKALHVSMRVYQHPTENRTFFSPDREPALALSVPVWHIAGLNNFSIPKPRLKKVSAANANAIHPNAGGSGPAGAFRPSDMRAAYYGGTTLTGSGQSVAMVEFDGYNMVDVTGDMGGTAINVPITNVLIDGAAAGSDGDDGEQALDIAQAIGMAPALTSVRVYIAPGTTSIGVGDVDMFNRIATDNISKSISCSWGWNPDDIAQNDPIFQEYQTQGQSLFVASGDSGAYTGSNATDESFPAEDVFVTAVGGTDLTTAGAGGPWSAETAWPDSGGGPADNGFAQPSYQSGTASTANGGSTTIRNIPDVAAEANFDNILCSQGTCTDNQTGGTSYAAPRWAGFIALVNQQSVGAGHGTVGFINPSIYAIGKSTSFTSDFHDITSGNNRNSGGKSFNAVTGYDLVTGWGSPSGQNLINAMAGGAAAADFGLSASPTSVSVAQGSTGTSTITETDLNGFTGSVTLSASGLPAGVTATFGTNPTTSTSVVTFTASSTATTGTSTVTITGVSGSLTHTTTISLTVTTVAAPNFSLSASPASVSVTQGGTGTSTITETPSGGFTGSVTLSASGLPAGVTAAFGTNPTTSTSVLTFTASSTATTGTATVTVTGVSGTLSHSTTISLTVNSSAARNLIVNGGFETGTATPWTLTTGVLNNNAAEPPHTGSWDAWLDGYGVRHTDTATQTVAIPSTITTATLTFFLHIDTAETTTTTAFDTLTVQVLNSAGTSVLATLGTFSNLNHATGYLQHSFSVAQFKGQTVRIRFTGTEDTSLQTSFVIDDVALNVQ
jgi:subtilase family serine protease